MRALSLDLVRGSIDQVEQRVHMTMGSTKSTRQGNRYILTTIKQCEI